MSEPKMKELLAALDCLKSGQFFKEIPVNGNGDFNALAKSINALGRLMAQRAEETAQLLKITEKINSGLVLEQILDDIYASLRDVIPYDRIGVSFLENNGRMLTAFWARSDSSDIKISKGYSALMEKSSLLGILQTGQPRILNDLESYLKEHPRSDSTRRVVEEGMRSSLTCPLIAAGKPIGFLFFSSHQADAYQDVHVEVFREIAGQLSLAIEKSRLYEQILFQNEQLKKLDKIKSDFVAIVSHELRTPLAIVTEGISLVIDGIAGEINQQQKDLLVTAKQNMGRLTSIINDLLDISKIEAGRVDLHLGLTDIKKLLMDLVNSFQKMAGTKKLSIDLRLPPEEVVLYVDADKMVQIFTNLISNAIKFTQPNGKIELILTRKNEDVLCVIKDNGMGISSEDKGKLFEKFQQFSRSDGPGMKGTGLGLSITKALVDLHGGQIWAESEINKGTTFSILLPSFEKMKKDFESKCADILTEPTSTALLVLELANAQDFLLLGTESKREIMNTILGLVNKTVIQVGKRVFPLTDNRIYIILPNADKALAASWGRQIKEVIRKRDFIFEQKKVTPHLNWGAVDSSSKPKNLFEMVKSVQSEMNRPKTVLIVDDNPELVEILKKRLSLRGYAVEAAYDGIMGLESAKMRKPDLIILDIDMPKMNGYEVFGRLKENAVTLPIPVIMLTAYDVDMSKIDAAGSLDLPVMQKTESFEKVVAAVDNLL